MKSFLEKILKLNISDRKSGISHFGKGFRYLGYDVISVSLDRIVRTVKSDRHTKVKSIAEIVNLRVPYDKGINFAKAHGYVSPDLKSYLSRPELLYRSDAEIITIYNAEFRGLCNYYALAGDVKIKLHRLEYIWKGSLLATLAKKHKSSSTQVAKSILNGEFLYRMTVNGKVRTLKCFSLKDIPKIKPNWGTKVDEIKNFNNVKHAKTEMMKRLTADTCEFCGRTGGYFEVHHVGKLKDINPKDVMGKRMSGMKRKTIVLCITCHERTHAGTLPDLRAGKF